MKKLISILAVSVFLIGTATIGVFAYQGRGSHMGGSRYSGTDTRNGFRHEHDELCFDDLDGTYTNKATYESNEYRGRMMSGSNYDCH